MEQLTVQTAIFTNQEIIFPSINNSRKETDMFRKIIIIILATCCLVIPLQAVQHSPPWADNYDFNYTPPIVLPNYTLDTRYSANDAANKQDLMGYDGHANTDYSAGQAFNCFTG